MDQSIVWLFLIVAATVQQVSSDHLPDVELRDVAAVINGGPLKPLSFIEKSKTKDIDLLATELANQYVPASNSLEDIELCIMNAETIKEKYVSKLRSGHVTKKLIDGSNSIERAAHLLGALPCASASCELFSYLDLMDIFKAAAGDSIRSFQANDPVRSSIVAALKHHRSHCSGSYHDRLKEAFNGIDAGTRSAVSKLFDLEVLEQIFPGYNSNPMVLFESTNTQETLMKNSGLLMKKMTELSGLKSASDEGRFVAEILPNQLIGPCKSFIDPLEKILLPAKADMALRDTTLSSLGLADRESTDIWARFHICSSVQYNEAAIKRGLRAEFALKLD